MRSGLAGKFLLEWKCKHFERGTEAYVYREEDMNDRLA